MDIIFNHMVNYLSSDLDLLFYALSNATRRGIVDMLNKGSCTIGELAEPFQMSLAAISKHVKILEDAQLLIRRKSGRIHECSINPEAMKSVEEYVRFYTQFWTQQLDAFAEELECNEENTPASLLKKKEKPVQTTRRSRVKSADVRLSLKKKVSTIATAKMPEKMSKPSKLKSRRS